MVKKIPPIISIEWDFWTECALSNWIRNLCYFISGYWISGRKHQSRGIAIFHKQERCWRKRAFFLSCLVERDSCHKEGVRFGLSEFSAPKKWVRFDSELVQWVSINIKKVRHRSWKGYGKIIKRRKRRKGFVFAWVKAFSGLMRERPFGPKVLVLIFLFRDLVGVFCTWRFVLVEYKSFPFNSLRERRSPSSGDTRSKREG